MIPRALKEVPYMSQRMFGLYVNNTMSVTTQYMLYVYIMQLLDSSGIL